MLSYPIESLIPGQFLERLRDIVPGHAFDSVVDSFSARTAVGLRVNTLLTTVDAAVKKLNESGVSLTPLPWYRAGFSISGGDRSLVTKSGLYLDRHVYLQNVSSMIPVLELDVVPGHIVLDLAAAPGSKTLQIASALNGEGHLAAVEIVRKRFFKLKKNLADQGARDVKVYLQDGRKASRYRPDFFDRVLLDAPCSTEGRFVADDDRTYRYWSVRKIREMAHKQKQLLESAIRCTRPGGSIVYSTCSFAPEENEEVILHALDTFGDAVCLEPLTVPVESYSPALTGWGDKHFDDRVGESRRIIPGGAYEAFYIAKLRRVG